MESAKTTEAIRERVGAYLERDGETKKSIAHSLEMTTATLNNKLNGVTEFTMSEAIQLSKILGCTLSELTNSPFSTN